MPFRWSNSNWRWIARLSWLPFALLSGCTDTFKTWSNGEAYSGNKPPKGNYYQVDSRAVCQGSGGKVTGYRGVLEVDSDSKARYRGACETSYTEVKLTDLTVSALGTGDLSDRAALLSYQGGLFDALETVPSSTSADLVTTRAWFRAAQGSEAYDVIVRAKGDVERPTNAKALVLETSKTAAGTQTLKVLGEIAVVAGSASADARTYLGDSFRLALTTSGGAVTAALTATVGGASLNLSSAASDDTFLAPPPPAQARPIVLLSASNEYACGANAGVPYCWGRGNTSLLGNGTTSDFHVPTALQGLTSGVTAISTGMTHACAVQNQKVYCWGDNTSGQIGDGTSSLPKAVPTLTAVLTQASAVANGQNHTCAIEAKKVYCWGSNSNGQLGDGTNNSSFVPQAVVGIPDDVTSIAAGTLYSCAVTVKGDAYCWGYHGYGQLGINATTGGAYPSPQKIAGFRFVSISAVDGTTCGLTDQGQAMCWGVNLRGQANGVSPSAPIGLPTMVAGLPAPLTSVAAGAHNSCAVQGGRTLCWGDNTYGQIGIGTISSFEVPTVVLNAGTLGFAVGFGTTFAQTELGLFSWGTNTVGELGDGSTTNRLSPVPWLFP